MQCANVYEENHAFLTFTDSATHFLRSTTSGAAAGGAGGSGRHLLRSGKLLIKNLFWKVV